MECPRRWAVLLFFIYLTANEVHVSCQNIVADSKRETCQNPSVSKPQLINTLFSLPTTNGGLSDLGTVFHHSWPQEHSCLTTIQDVPKTINVIPLAHQPSSFYQQEPIAVSGQPFATASFSNVSPIMPPNVYYPSVSALPCTTTSEQSLDNCAGYMNPSSIWKVQQPANEIYSCAPVQQITFAEAALPSVNSHAFPTCSVSQPNAESNFNERDCDTNIGVSCQEPVVTTEHKQGLPVNLQINIPAQNTPPPTITFVSAMPHATPSSPEPLPCSVVGFSPPPPIIITKSKSSWKKLLPIILIALLCDQNNHAGCCGCFNKCNCDSESIIPIPYPIPIPISNPIVNTENKSMSGSRKRKNKCNSKDDKKIT